MTNKKGVFLNSIQNLFYQQGDFCLKIPKLDLPTKGILLLTGPSGSGKSTFLNVLAGLLKCPQMTWNFKNKNLALLAPHEKGINYCFQDLRLFPLMTAKENILFALKAKKIPFKEKQKEFEELIDSLGLKTCLNLSIEKLSGGEKQRTALARSLISSCDILFLDEPFSYLDKTNKQRARDFVQAYVEKNQIPCFLASHEKESPVASLIQLHQGQIKN